MSIYEQIYDLINTYIYGGVIVSGSYQELVCTLVSTSACIFMFCVPFIVCYAIIRAITR